MDDVYHLVSRRHRHATRLAFIFALTDTLIPLIITVTPIRHALWIRGLKQNGETMTH
jgi:hypothetical protein